MTGPARPSLSRQPRIVKALLLTVSLLLLSLVAGYAAGQPGTRSSSPAKQRVKPARATSQPSARPVVQAPTAPASASSAAQPSAASTPVYFPGPRSGPAVMLGIDVLAAQNFAPIAGKRVGLLTHPPGVNRLGVSTIDVLRAAPNVKLVALFGPEHGIYGKTAASVNITDTIDKRTGLPAYSLYGNNRKPTKKQLQGLDALLIDMQDIGVRSYTFSVCMKYAMEACFEHGIEVIVLDRPNPLGGLKVDGPLLDRQFFSGVGQFAMPYVHGLTMGELARLAAGTPGGLDISEAARARGKLTVIPMQGWRRSMRWPETGLKFVPTSPYIQDFAACVGYAMTGLGCQIGGFSHGIGTQYPFRGVSTKLRSMDQVQKELTALRLPGLAFKKVSLTSPNGAPMGIGIYVEVNDWDDWNPTELSFHLMRLAALYNAKNPFAAATSAEALLFNKHTGSAEWWNAIKRDGSRVDLTGFLRKWKQDALLFQQSSRRFWLYE
ncbi:hypothetical protein CMV30_03445 [Nibricoccus aquaticus]|uniref:DUF1343 domain-containing protein n=2 Tax=Nibricoccus aquaticus TaxID=2576891 RepID=A0A290Q333_9BACT|nr:hypothetical protein CMV30_03445 [Nibricoccus aquaticus]